MKRVLAGFVALTIALGSGAAQAAYVYVGRWNLETGPSFETNPPVYSGQEAAALLFGGSPSDYVISTAGSDPASVNFLAWTDTYGASSLTQVAQDYSYSPCTGAYVGEYACDGAISAYVTDHFTAYLLNYAFLVTDVPEPASLAMFGAGLAGLGLLRRRTRG